MDNAEVCVPTLKACPFVRRNKEMTIADFLYQAGFWQWVGMIFLAAALAQFSFVTINKHNCESDDKSK